MRSLTLLPSLLFLFCLGCATVGNSSLNERGDDWPPITMTKAELMKELGPAKTSTLTQINGQTTESLTWVYAHAETNPALWIPIVGLFVAASGNGMNVESHGLTAMFDGQGKMISRSRSSSRIGNQAPTKPYVQDF